MKRNLPDNTILDAFPENEREEVARLWQKAGDTRRSAALDKEALEAEWLRLQHRLTDTEKGGSMDTGKDQAGRAATGKTSAGAPTGSAKKQRARIHRLYYAVAAAAALFLAVFAGWYYFVPVTVEAPRGQYLTHEWHDGSRVELNSGSSVTWTRAGSNAHRSLRLEGEAYFTIPESDEPFVVETFNAKVRVYGTRFNLRSWSGDPDARTELTLVNGSVSLTSAFEPDDSVFLQPGQWSQIDQTTVRPTPPSEVDTLRALAWREQGFFFSASSIKQVATELERRFLTEIEIENESLAARRISLYLPSPDNVESIIESICHLIECRYDWSDDRIVLY